MQEQPPRTELLTAFPYLNIYLLRGPQPALETEWRGFVGSADFRSALAEALELARKHAVVGWVADDRRLGALRPKDLDWSFRYLHAPLAELGVRRFAQLEAEEPLNRFIIGTKYQQATAALPFELRQFADLDLARRWACG
ncbi:hypothetical protein [Hymenobacter persicinus]|uniref:STAS/SEC14 domain-containing protein n=1 Tax=Hymenobacter persicinus TaxID=2025506 RepID=A0A4Q5L8A5_9BACT|nr:hypothetical protein [Hymenobacter persicinus]RYU77850.1 hypothetical protein EWM57_16475 [Hymenobacter persicinus]